MFVHMQVVTLSAFHLPQLCLTFLYISGSQPFHHNYLHIFELIFSHSRVTYCMLAFSSLRPCLILLSFCLLLLLLLLLIQLFDANDVLGGDLVRSIPCFFFDLSSVLGRLSERVVLVLWAVPILYLNRRICEAVEAFWETHGCAGRCTCWMQGVLILLFPGVEYLGPCTNHATQQALISVFSRFVVGFERPLYVRILVLCCIAHFGTVLVKWTWTSLVFVRQSAFELACVLSSC